MDEILWEVDEGVKSKRLQRFTVPLEEQGEYESANLWRKVGAAIDAEDQVCTQDIKFFYKQVVHPGVAPDLLFENHPHDEY